MGGIPMGGGHVPVVQSMWKSPLSEEGLPGIAEELNTFLRRGCQVMRFAVPSLKDAALLGKLASRVDMPLVADIHFDYKIALACLDYPIAKIRINPGNIGEDWKVEEVVRKAAGQGVPLRIGVNSGSLPEKLIQEEDRAGAMVQAALEEVEILERLNFKDVLVSLKASDPETTVEANRRFARQTDIPLHIGVTEAGPLIPAVVRSTDALVTLLREGIGDTIRVSISGAPLLEVQTAREILITAGYQQPAIRIVSCPRCGRATFDTHGFLQEAESLLLETRKNLHVAIMGCLVNGPGEARDADIGLSGTGNSVSLFRQGKVIRRIPREMALEALEEELDKL